MDTTTLLEEYVLALDKNKYLTSIMSSLEYNELHIFHKLATGQPVDKRFEGLLEKDTGTLPRLRLILKRLEDGVPEEEAREYLDELNSLYFRVKNSHQRQGGDQPPKPKPEAKKKRGLFGGKRRGTEGSEEAENDRDSSKISKEGFRFGKSKKLINDLYELDKEAQRRALDLLVKIGPLNFPKIDIKKVKNPKAQQEILRLLDNYQHIKNLSGLFSQVKKRYFKLYESKLHFGMEYYKKMTLAEIEAVTKALDTQESMEVHLRRFEIEFYDLYTKLEDTEDELKLFAIFKEFKQKVDEKKKSFAKTSILASVGKFLLGEWDPYLGALSRLLNKCLLINTLRRDKLDESLFKKFLERPVDTCWFTGLSQKARKKFYKNFTTVNQAWREFVNHYSETYSDADLVDRCLQKLVVNKSTIEAYTVFFEEDYLEKLYYTHLARDGGSLERLKNYLAPSELAELENRVKLQLSERNLSSFNKNDIELSILVKNVPKLEIREYEFDVFRYLKEHGKDPEFDINLDGLLPRSRRELKYDFLKQHEHLETFKFPEFDKKQRGYFIVDFIGGGLQSRAVVRKGALSLIHVPFEFGHKYFIIDENKNICRGKRTGLYIGDRYLPSSRDGSILIPFDKSKFESDVILVHDDFAFKSRIEVPMEAYELKSALIFNEEALIAGRKARFILRNKLFLNKRPISAKKLKNVNLRLNLTTQDGVSNVKAFDDIEIIDGKDYVFDFIVPNKLTRVVVSTTASVDSVAQGKVLLSFSETINVARNEGRNVFVSEFLRKDDNGYHVLLRGRNGEPIEKKQVEVVLERFSDKAEHSEALVSSGSGEVHLGSLEGISRVQINGLGAKPLVLRVNGDSGAFELPESFNLCEGDDLVLPSLGCRLDRGSIRLWQVSEDSCFLKDCFDSVNIDQAGGGGGQASSFVVSLKPGIYEFVYFLEYQKVVVDIYVEKSKRWKHSNLMIEGDFDLRHVIGELNYININSVDVLRRGQSDSNTPVKQKTQKKVLTTPDTEIEVRMVSNDLDNCTVHVLGYHHSPLYADLMRGRVGAVSAKMSSETHELARTENIYVSERVLSDELSYVLRRNQDSPPIGNTFPKPSILLHRKFIRETKDEEEVLQKGKEFDKDDIDTGLKNQNKRKSRKRKKKRKKEEVERASPVVMMAQKQKKSAFLGGGLFGSNKKELDFDPNLFINIRGGSSQGARGGGGSHLPPKRIPEVTTFDRRFDLLNDFDYVQNSGDVLANLKPDPKSGILRFKLGDLAEYPCLVFIATDTYGTASAQLDLPASYKIKRNDLRLAESQPEGVIYTEQRYTLGGEENQELLIKDAKNTQSLIMETLKDFFDSYSAISPSRLQPEINKWKFLATWASLNREKKLEKLEEFGGHELNVFCYFKDRAFFEQNIKPVLSFKAEKELIDYLLIADAEYIEEEFSPVLIGQYSPVEVVLLVDYFKKKGDGYLAQRLVNCLKEKTKLFKPPAGYIEGKYDAILSSNNEDEKRKKKEEELKQKEKAIAELRRREEEYRQRAMNQERERDHYRMRMEEEERRPRRSDEEEMRRREEEERRRMEEEYRFREAQNGRRQLDSDLLDFGGSIEVNEATRVKIKKYEKAGKTHEFCERQGYFSHQPGAESFNPFWLGVLESILEGSGGQVANDHFMLLTAQINNLPYALAFTDLPFTAGDLQTRSEDQNLYIKSTKKIIILSKKIEQKRTDQLKMDLILSQKFYDPEDKFTFDETDKDIKRIKKVKKFVKGRVYESQISITNISESSLRLKLITQIPQGALPVNQLDFLKINELAISALSTQIRRFQFYFPASGRFKCYPSTLMKDNKFVSSAKIGQEFEVLERFETENATFETLQDILNYGSGADILKYMESKNLFNPNLFKIEKILWLLSNKNHYFKVKEILKRNCIFDRRVWGYSFKHYDFAGFEEFANQTTTLRELFAADHCYKNKFVRVDRFKPLEYDPLINPRAHSLSQTKQNIRNKEFKKTYEGFLRYCCQKGVLGSREWVIFAAYLALQDRVELAGRVLNKVDVIELKKRKEMVLQYDYLRAYLSIYKEFPRFQTARKIVKKHLKFSDLTWRRRFQKIDSQLKEYDGEDGASTADVESVREMEREGLKVKHSENQDSGKKAEYLKVERGADKQTLCITHMNIHSIKLKFYILDAELLFTKDPFLSKNIKNFAYINPNQLLELPLQGRGDFETEIVDIPTELQSKSLFVSVESRDKSDTLKIFNSRFEVNVVEQFGLLKVIRRAEDGHSHDLLSSVYVKCYYRPKRGGEAVFYKDGYTDFRGSFDYASLNSESLDLVEKFSILVVSEEFGAAVVQASPPSGVGEVEVVT